MAETTMPSERAPDTDHVILTGSAPGGATHTSDTPLPLKTGDTPPPPRTEIDSVIRSTWDQPQQMPQPFPPRRRRPPFALRGASEPPFSGPPQTVPATEGFQTGGFQGAEAKAHAGGVARRVSTFVINGQPADLSLERATGQGEATHPSPISRNLSLQPEHVASQARLFVEAIRSQIAAMPPTPNEPDKLEFHNGLIEFLEELAAGLSELAETLDKMAANRGNANEPIFLGKAATIANHLGIGAMDYVAKNREKLAGTMIQGSFYVAAALLAMSLGIDKEFLEAIAKVLRPR
jgi:hypothetical protein